MKIRFSANDWQLADLVSFALAVGSTAIVIVMAVIHSIVGLLAFGVLWFWLVKRTAAAWLGWVELELDRERWKVREGAGPWCWRRYEFDAAAIVDVRVASYYRRNVSFEGPVVRVRLSAMGSRQNELFLGRGTRLGPSLDEVAKLLAPSSQPPAETVDKSPHG
jgi:hypothetical protein